MRMKSVLRSRTASRRILPYSLTAVLPTFDAEKTHCRVKIFCEKRASPTPETKNRGALWTLGLPLLYHLCTSLRTIVWVWHHVQEPGKISWFFILSGSYRGVLFARLFSRVFFHYDALDLKKKCSCSNCLSHALSHSYPHCCCLALSLEFILKRCPSKSGNLKL